MVSLVVKRQSILNFAVYDINLPTMKFNNHQGNYSINAHLYSKLEICPKPKSDASTVVHEGPSAFLCGIEKCLDYIMLSVVTNINTYSFATYKKPQTKGKYQQANCQDNFSRQLPS